MDSGLADFLQACRARLRPQDVGLVPGDRRRVPGLRREELAQLAGVSTSYYVRLEQGQSRNASPEVIDALARALRLDEAERQHLHDLARAGQRARRARGHPVERVSEVTVELLRALGDTPALVLGRGSDVLAWNPIGHALLAGHLDFTAPQRPADRPNMARQVFLDAHTRELYANWTDKALAVVANLRLMTGRYPGDAALTGLIGELTTRSPEFARFWAGNRVAACNGAVYRLRHPLVGALTVLQQTLIPVGEWSQTLVVSTPREEASRSALALLAHEVSSR
ncbi:helix-turn-helix transcriptional regulator [Crossiella sp. CA-258035]|uniref:helix-turn-helix domain-containing protein n=1 Tax=Crossiella sp. CA-258035 TaxID=2981138 RepID=UPI0024BD3751|nr:helix-turn-helix transcriptional regulator [Crossiella sp. CA-258035]WHT19997.1 helix-turn-helix transcriptional regulator [Crossiella sp. CA-258035]